MILNILEFPDPRLRTKAKPIEDFGQDLHTLIDNMLETMYAAPGIGLAATQVNTHRRLMVVDISEEKNTPRVFINPEILEKEGSQVYQEGCLSVPDIYADIVRAEKIRVKAQNRDQTWFELAAEGLLAVCIQHEIDHLDGKVFIDYLSPLKREKARKILEKQHNAGTSERKTHVLNAIETK